MIMYASSCPPLLLRTAESCYTEQNDSGHAMEEQAMFMNWLPHIEQCVTLQVIVTNLVRHSLRKQALQAPAGSS
jgi:hypothetical protein